MEILRLRSLFDGENGAEIFRSDERSLFHCAWVAPAFMLLVQRISSTGLILRIKAVKLFLQSILGGLARVNGAAEYLLSHGA